MGILIFEASDVRLGVHLEVWSIHLIKMFNEPTYRTLESL